MLTFHTDIDGADELERALDEAAQAASDGLRRGLAEGLEAGAAYARTAHPYQDKTGALTRSIRGRVEVSTPGAAVGVIEATAKHAVYVETGTRAHVIEPRNKRALHWTGAGGEHFATRVEHPGTKPTPFVRPAAEVAEQHIERAIELDIILNVERILSG